VLIKLSLPLAGVFLLFIAPTQAHLIEKIHYDHAPVLQVEPVLQTVQATHTHEYCTAIPTASSAEPVSVSLPSTPQRPGFLEHLRTLFASVTSMESASPEPVYRNETPTPHRCQRVEAGSHYQRVVAWDVDYIYQGKKYRSRLPLDPGNCLRLRVSITPLLETEVPAQAFAE